MILFLALLLLGAAADYEDDIKDQTRDWRTFSQNNELSLAVDMADEETYFVRFPCTNFIWFKLFLYGENEQNSHVELESRTKGNIFCKKGGSQSWYWGQKTDFRIYRDWRCEDDEKFMILEVEKTTTYVALKNRGNTLYTKRFGSHDGNCGRRTDRVATQVFKYSGSLSLAFTTRGGWIAVKRGVDIDHDLETTPLGIKTDSKTESDNQIFVRFHAASGMTPNAGGIILRFSGEYIILSCSSTSPRPRFSTFLPAGKEKVWKITLTRVTGVRLQVHCNNLEVLNVLLSDTTCSGNPNWRDKWNNKVKKIQFDSPDSASDYYKPYTGWKEVQRDVEITHDLERKPLEITTDSETGSDDQIYVTFLTDKGYDVSAGGVILRLKGKYVIVTCNGPTDYSNTLPAKQKKIWKITLTRSSGVRLQVHCNDVEVVNVLLSEKCTINDWNKRWSKNVKKIKFHSADNASDYYIPVKCTSLNASWTNMAADKDFPVDSGTVLTLSCEAGYRLEGAQTVTCTENTEFTDRQKHSPTCVYHPYCKELELDNVVVYPRGEVKESDAVTVTCVKPSRNVVFGDRRITCQRSDSGLFNWSITTTPECRACGNCKVII